MAIFQVTKRQTCGSSFSCELSLLVFTIALTVSFLCAPLVCASSAEGPEHVPTLKEIYGSVPKNSFPVVGREAGILQSEVAPGSFRRGLRSKPNALTIQASNVGFSSANSGLSAYYAQLQIGTPPQDLLLVIDTGSSIFWTQSKQCTECFPELLPRYDPTVSSTYEPEIVNSSWAIEYGDGTGNIGYRARETLTIDSGYGNRVVIPGFEFGVAVNNTGRTYYEFSGVLGLSPTYPGAQISPFLTQLETISNGTYSKVSKTFRYCFPDRVKQVNTTSFLSFGEIEDSDPKHRSRTLWTPLVPNGDPNPFYALNLTAITVGGMRIQIDPKELTLESVQVNETMTIIDSGSTMNTIREPYFSQFVGAYYNATITLGPTIVELDGFFQQFYYNISKDTFDAALFPSVSFIFQKWQPDGQMDEQHEEIEVFQSKDNVIIPTQMGNSSDVIYELNIRMAFDTMNVIGNYAQENLLIEFDLEKSRLGFLPASCTFDY